MLAAFEVLSVAAADKLEWSLGKQAKVEITPFGGLARVTDGGKLVIGSSQIYLHKTGKGGVIYQGSGFVAGGAAEIKQTDAEVVATGSLLDERSANAPKVADYVVTYKKVADGVFQIRVEVTFLKDGEWGIPPQFSLSFPFAEYRGAEFVTTDREGTERTYVFEDKPVKFESYGFQDATLTKGGVQIKIEPVGNSVINFQDSRSWGGDYLRVDATQKQKWETPFAFKSGTTQSFEVRVAITSK